ncbi:MAG: hypothetical protein PG978_000929 [Wolbachia endosymbiont of Ctenocephalides felis wCfeF]|nr:MAG: hypothetical protein PG978_000929 [Wolbachia endosymbiont of Ctenocephalides felis wCfeF]
MTKEIIRFQKPWFDKPEFIKPEITPLFFDKKADKEIDITVSNINAKEIDEKMMVNAVRFKTFYDNLINSVNKYNEDINSSIENGIINPLSAIIDSIGQGIGEINSKLKNLQSELNNLRDEIPDIGEAPPRITGEENGLF